MSALLLSLCCALILFTTIAGRSLAAAGDSVWEHDGLGDREIRSLILTSDNGTLIALAATSSDVSPLWRRDERGWTAVPSPASLVLTLQEMPDGGMLLGAGRDLTDRPGLVWLNEGGEAPRYLYESQAIGAIAARKTELGTEIFAATAPWADRDAASELLRRDPVGGGWSALLQAKLDCPGGQSYFRQIVAPGNAANLLLALEWCVTSTMRRSQLWRSDDAGRTWQPLSRPDGSYPLVTFVAAIVGESELLVMGGRTDGAEIRGVERSRDGGQSWDRRGGEWAELTNVRTLLVDKQNASRILAGTERGGVYRSDDAGETWRPMTGLEGISVGSLVIDERNRRLYAGTTRGVWRAPYP